MEFEDILRQAEMQLQNSNNFEDMDEDFEAEHFRKRMVRAGKNISQAEAKRIIKNVKAQNNPVSLGSPNAPIGNVQAQFDLVIAKQTNLIPDLLPIMLFAPVEAESSYTKFINPELPAGVTLDSFKLGFQSSSNDSAQFTFKKGADTDIVKITCQQIEYPVLMKNIESNKFKVNKLRLAVSDTVGGLSQFNNQLTFGYRTMFGKFEQDSVSPLSYKSPEQFQQGIIDIPVSNAEIDRSRGILTKVFASLQTYTLSVFVSSSVRY